MNKPHKHAEVIKAWADGAHVQYKHPKGRDWTAFPDHSYSQWNGAYSPSVNVALGEVTFLWRVKPEPIPAGTVLMRCYYKACMTTETVDEQVRDVWGHAAELFIKAIKNGEVKE